MTFFIYKFLSIQDIKRKQRFVGDLESFYSPRQALHTDFAEQLDTLVFKTIFHVFFLKILKKNKDLIYGSIIEKICSAAL